MTNFPGSGEAPKTIEEVGIHLFYMNKNIEGSLKSFGKQLQDHEIRIASNTDAISEDRGARRSFRNFIATYSVAGTLASAAFSLWSLFKK